MKPIECQGIWYQISPSKSRRGVMELYAPPHKKGWMRRTDMDDVRHANEIFSAVLKTVHNRNQHILHGKLDGKPAESVCIDRQNPKLPKLIFHMQDQWMVEEILESIISRKNAHDLPRTYTIGMVETSADNERFARSKLSPDLAGETNRTSVNVTVDIRTVREVPTITVSFDLGYNDEERPLKDLPNEVPPKFRYTRHDAAPNSATKSAVARQVSSMLQNKLNHYNQALIATGGTESALEFTELDSSQANFIVSGNKEAIAGVAILLKETLTELETQYERSAGLHTL